MCAEKVNGFKVEAERSTLRLSRRVQLSLGFCWPSIGTWDISTGDLMRPFRVPGRR